jgi:hypothetical protein
MFAQGKDSPEVNDLNGSLVIPRPKKKKYKFYKFCKEETGKYFYCQIE